LVNLFVKTTNVILNMALRKLLGAAQQPGKFEGVKRNARSEDCRKTDGYA